MPAPELPAENTVHPDMSNPDMSNPDMSNPGAASRRIYLDHAATTPLRPEVVAAMDASRAASAGNPSSIHAEGVAARAALEEARARICEACGARGYDLLFLGGGTEANNTALLGSVLAARRRARGTPRRTVGFHLITTAVEHPSVLNVAPFLRELGTTVTVLGVDRDGRVEAETIQDALMPQTLLVSVQAANNETGTLQPVTDIAARLQAVEVLFHVDAVQLLGKRPFRVDALGADFVTVSAHKIHGPKGVAGLFVRQGVELEPLLRGGNQESGLRAGTENVSGAVGFARAVELAVAEAPALGEQLVHLRDEVASGVAARFPESVRNSPLDGVLPHFLNFSFPSVEGESLLRTLDGLGIAASTGSACSVGAKRLSHVLRAMGRSEREIRGSLRLSFGRGNHNDSAPTIVERIVAAVERLETLAPKS